VSPRLHTCTKRELWYRPLLHTSDTLGLSISPIMYRCLLRVLCPVSKPVTTLDCILVKDSSLVLTVGQGMRSNL